MQAGRLIGAAKANGTTAARATKRPRAPFGRSAVATKRHTEKEKKDAIKTK